MDKQRYSQRRSLDRTQLARDLACLASLEEAGDEAAERRASAIISQCIEARDDATLANGLVQTTETEAHELLWQQINFFASTALLQERRTGAPVLTELFAIPLLLIDDTPFTPPDLLCGTEELRRLARRCGLLNYRHDRLFLLPQLFTHTQLEQLSWSGLYDLTAELSHTLSRPHSARIALPGLPEKSPATRTAAGRSHLRFIVGGSHFNPDIADMPLLREENSDKYQVWCEEVAGFQRLSPHIQVTLFKPAFIPEALVLGQMHLRLYELKTALMEALAVTETDPPCLSVYISVHGESEASIKEFRMAPYAWDDPDEQVFARVWPLAPHENPNEIAEHLCSLFEAIGAVNVFVIGEVQPDDRCDCCGGPLFRGPMETDDMVDRYPVSPVVH